MDMASSSATPIRTNETNGVDQPEVAAIGASQKVTKILTTTAIVSAIVFVSAGVVLIVCLVERNEEEGEERKSRQEASADRERYDRGDSNINLDQINQKNAQANEYARKVGACDITILIAATILGCSAGGALGSFITKLSKTRG